MTAFKLVFKDDEYEKDQIKYISFTDIFSAIGGFATFVFFIFKLIFSKWFQSMLYQTQAQEIHNEEHPEREQMTPEEEQEITDDILARTSIEGICSLHSHIRQNQTESDERFESLEQTILQQEEVNMQ